MNSLVVFQEFVLVVGPGELVMLPLVLMEDTSEYYLELNPYLISIPTHHYLSLAL